MSEALWVRTTPQMTAILRAMRDLAGENGDSLFGSIWRDVDCRSLSESDLGAALHLATLAPAWTDPDFLACVVERESGSEAFPLWSALDAALVVPGSGSWVRDADYRDGRTLWRLQRLRGEPEADRIAPRSE